jgi:hypothetical protein
LLPVASHAAIFHNKAEYLWQVFAFDVLYSLESIALRFDVASRATIEFLYDHMLLKARLPSLALDAGAAADADCSLDVVCWAG